MRTGLRVEPRLQRCDGRTETSDHGFKHVITTNAQPTSDDLDFSVAIAKMPGQMHETPMRAWVYFAQSLGVSGNSDNCSIVEHKPVSVPKRDRLRQIEQKLRSILGGQHRAPTVAIVGVEQDAAD
jgi:hypothetical protein